MIRLGYFKSVFLLKSFPGDNPLTVSRVCTLARAYDVQIVIWMLHYDTVEEMKQVLGETCRR